MWLALQLGRMLQFWNGDGATRLAARQRGFVY